MDLLWLFILIFGVVVSIGQKSQKKAPAEGETVSEELDPHQEFERRIRELLQEEDKPAAKPVANASTQVATEVSVQAKVEKTQSRVATKKACAERPKEQPKEADELDQIVNDFSIEKAVIYAEILKPKCEEY